MYIITLFLFTFLRRKWILNLKITILQKSISTPQQSRIKITVTLYVIYARLEWEPSDGMLMLTEME